MQIEIPKLNTEVLFNKNIVDNRLYNSKPFMSTPWQQSLRYWEKYNKFNSISPQYFVKKTLDDSVTIQIAYPENPPYSLTGLAELFIEDCDGVRTQIQPTPYAILVIAGDVDSTGQQLRRVTWSFKLSDYITDEGNYMWYLAIDFGGGNVEEFIGAPMSIKKSHPNTLYFAMTHSTNDFDVWFDPNVIFYYRIDGNITFNSNKLERTTFRNQKANLRQLYARNWRVFDLELGFPSDGLNSYDQDKFYNFFKMDEIYIDGVRYLMEEDAEFERIDWGNRYPLSKLKTQIVEYDRSDSNSVGTVGSFFVMDLGALRGFPYLVDAFTFVGIGSPGEDVCNFLNVYAPVNFQAEILNATDENLFLAQLDVDLAAFGMLGEFFVDDDKLYYRRGELETYLPTDISVLGNCYIVDFQSSPGFTVIGTDVLQTGRCWITIRDSFNNYAVPPERWDGNFSTGYNLDPLYDDFKVRLYTDNTMTSLTSYSVISKAIKAVRGNVSSSLTFFSIYNAALNTFDFSLLKSARYTLATLLVNEADVSAFDFTDLTIVGDAGAWQNLRVISFAYNQLGFAEQDDFYNSFYPIAFAYRLLPLGAGILDTRFQVIASSPTAASLPARTAMASYGYLITF